jgi:hypothetical protein
MCFERASVIEVSVRLDVDLWRTVEEVASINATTASALVAAAVTSHLTQMAEPHAMWRQPSARGQTTAYDLAEVDPDMDATGCA